MRPDGRRVRTWLTTRYVSRAAWRLPQLGATPQGSGERSCPVAT
jgi:hypothetical protein